MDPQRGDDVKMHTVKAGEDMLTIARLNAFTVVEPLIDANPYLMRSRNPSLLRKGTLVKVPKPRDRQDSRETGLLHRYKIGARNCLLRIELRYFGGDPIKKKAYTLRLKNIVGQADETRIGTTDSKGLIEEKIAIVANPSASPEEIEVEITDLKRKWKIQLGHLGPADDDEGIQARLLNLQFDCSDREAALKEFHLWKNIKSQEGNATAATQAALTAEHEGGMDKGTG